MTSPTKLDKTRQPLIMRGSTHAKPDNSRHFPQIGPILTLKPQAATALAHCMYCHQMAPNGTNSRSYQGLVTSPVTNNGLFTRKIPFVTAPTPLLEFVTNSGVARNW